MKNKSMNRFNLLVAFFILAAHVSGQTYNSDPNKTYINQNLPKTPESAAFEKYGNYTVNELNGLPGISIPIHTVSGKFLSVPVSLSYHAGGIRVSQEASWVGLGFDLMYGGRITVEVKGRIDNDITAGYLGGNRVKTYMPKILNRLGNSNDRDILTVASEQQGNSWPGDPNLTDTLYDDEQSVRAMAAYGLGEPDIYNVSFGGNSFKFYYDMVDGNLNFLGEKNLLNINKTTDTYGRITSWQVIDNVGNVNFFTQQEISKCNTAPAYDQSSASTTTAWLLTKTVHPSGDSIVYRYSNFGEIWPAYDWGASLSGSYGGGSPSPSGENESEANRMRMEPAYLTQIESNNTQLNFILSGRNDIRGGARKLDEIDLVDKTTNNIQKKWLFNYDYFVGNVDQIVANQPDSVKNWSKYRLKLSSLVVNDSTIQSPYRFYYNSVATVPNKYSFCQDHWGYLNNISHNTIYYQTPSPQIMIPSMTSLINEGVETSPPAGFLPANLGIANRTCNPTTMATMTLDSIVYPTGGSTKFVFAPHQSWYYGSNTNLIGGGLRVESIKSYDGTGKMAGRTNYVYEEGRYLGAISYLNIFFNVDKGFTGGYCDGGSGNTFTKYSISSNGLYNKNDLLIGYSRITQKIADENNQANNGSVIKYYNVTPYYQMNSLKPQLVGPHYPGCTCGGTCVTTHQLYSPWYCLPPSPLEQLDGKLLKEEYLNNAGALQKSTDYYYKQVGYSQKLYSIKVKDNIIGGVQVGGPLCAPTAGFCNGWRRYLMVVSPAKSYYTQLDSVIEKTYQGADFVKQKKANTYNSYNQVEFSTGYNSDGTQSITFTKTPLSFVHPPVPSGGEGDALSIEQMRSGHMYDLPIEQTSISRTASGDSLVTGSLYNVYEWGTMKKVYALETNSPLTFRTQFLPSYYYYNYPTLPSFNVVIDSKYKLQDSAAHYPDKFIKDIVSKGGNKSFIWDEVYNTVLAQCINASSDNIAYSSFETAATGNWTYSGTASADANAITGTKTYNLGNGGISRAGLNVTKTYVVSCWSKTGTAITITGGTILSSTTGRTLGDWTYLEYKINNLSSLTISGSGDIDELRLYPENALMSTYAYKPMVGIANQCDANNRISQYVYDNSGRLILILDQDKNILKKICYNYAGKPEDCNSPCTNAMPNWQNTTTALRCQQGLCGNTGYQEQEQRDMNPCSPTYNNPTRWVLAGYNPTACPVATGVTITSQNNINVTGFTVRYTNSSTGQIYIFNIPAGSGSIGCIPAGTYSIYISKPGNSMLVLFGCGCRAASGTSATFTKVIVGSSSCNTITLDYDY